MRISILGAGDVSKISRFTSMKEDGLDKLIERIAQFLAEKGADVVIIPNRGVPLEIAKKYRERGGKKVLGVIPIKDKDYGLAHIEEFLPLVDEKIYVDSWYDADGKIASEGEVCLVVGLSSGVLRALTALKFHQKYKGDRTKLIIFRNTISAELHKEVSEEMPITYIEFVEQLKELI
jgi:hypothetical protein